MTVGDEARGAAAFRRYLLALATAQSLLFAGACSDEDAADRDRDQDEANAPDGGNNSDGDDGNDERDAGSDAATDPTDDDGGSDESDGGKTDPDASAPRPPIVIGDGTPQVVPVSPTGHDRFYGVTYDPAGNIYVTGQTGTGTAAETDYALLLGKFLPTGMPDTSFGSAGFITLNVAVGGKGAEVARGIVVQSTGKIVIAGTAEHDPAAAGVLANDTDVVLARFNPDGTVDATFGVDGVVRHDLATGIMSMNSQGQPSIAGADAQWSLSLAAEDKLVVHGAQLAQGTKAGTADPRTDSDWALLRLKDDGSLDETFGTNGKVTLDIGEANASSRSATVLADGSIIGTGYTTTNVLNPMADATQQPVLYKVTPTGQFDATFATEDQWDVDGVYFDFTVAPPARGEAYGAALQGDNLVTMGYGPTQVPGAMGSDVVSFRFTGAGAHDKNYGTDGATWVDVAGYADNGRAVLVLPDQRVLGIGGGRPAPSTPPAMGNPPSDALLVLLTEDGKPDETFGMGGIRTYDLNSGSGDFFWAGAVSPDQKQVTIVGVRGAPTGENDDAAILILPLE
jgi:uncharacterized delta-60 repeat protein